MKGPEITGCMPTAKPPLDPAVAEGIRVLAQLLASNLTAEKIQEKLEQAARDQKMNAGHFETLVIEHRSCIVGIDHVFAEWVQPR